MKLKSITFLLLTCFIFSNLVAQDQVGRISGKVIDQNSGSGLGGARISLYRLTEEMFQSRSNSSGNFSFINVPAGQYRIITFRDNYVSNERLITVNANFTTKVNLSLNSTSTLSQTVAQQPTASEQQKTVQAPAPVVAVPVVTSANNQPPTTSIPTNNQKEITKPAEIVEQVQAEVPALQPTLVSEDVELIALTNEPVYVAIPEVSAEPVGGMGAIYKKIKYPEIARLQKVEGRVYLKVYVNKNGEVENVEYTKRLHPALDQAAIDAVYDSEFKPGTQGNIPIDSIVSLFIQFKLGK